MEERLKKLIGKKVYINWENDELNDNWHDFYVGAVKRNAVLLFGTFDKDGNRHEGKPFWSAIDEIKKVRRQRLDNFCL